MDKMNQRFQELLSSKNFELKMTEEDEQWVYQGKLALDDVHMVTFYVSLSKGESYSIGQIVYQNIAYKRDSDSDMDWYQVINDLNRSQGTFYYFCLDDDDRLFARYVSEVSADLDYFFHILVSGPAFMRQIISQLEERFGKFVVLD